MPDGSPRPLLALLSRLHRSRLTGVVTVVRGETRLTIELGPGRVQRVLSDSSRPEAVSDEDRELATLLEEAYGGHQELVRAAARHTLLEAMGWTDAECSFGEGAAEGADPPLELSTEELLREAASMLADTQGVRAALGDLERPLRVTLDPSALSNAALTPTEGYLLSRVDGVLSARAVLELLPLATGEAERNLLSLLVSGFVDYAPPAPPAAEGAPASVRAAEDSSPRDYGTLKALEVRRREVRETHGRVVGEKNHFEVLGLSPDASEAEVKQAYFRLARRFHPDTQADPGLADVRPMVQAVFARLGEAYDVLSHARRRAAYEETLPRTAFIRPPAGSGVEPRAASFASPPPVPGASPGEEQPGYLADEMIQRAEALILAEQYWEMIQLLEPVVSTMPGRRKQRARLLLARAYTKNPKWLKRGEQVLQEIVHDEPETVEAYLLLGTIYREGGLQNRAASMYKKVLELRPGHKQARDELASLGKGQKKR